MFEARFQSFDDSSERAQSAAGAPELRTELKRQGPDVFMVPRSDRQQNEYPPASEERLAWLTGFTGSAGTAVVLDDRAALFIDGRYTVQAGTPGGSRIFLLGDMGGDSPGEGLLEKIKKRGQPRGEPLFPNRAQKRKIKKT